MATGIICIILIMVCVLGIKSYAKKLTHGCCGGEDVTVKQVKPVDKDLSHYPYTYELQIDLSVDEIYVQKILPVKMKHNLKYLEHFSVAGDIKIMIQTVLAVIR